MAGNTHKVIIAMPSNTRSTVLIVEDEPASLNLLASYFEAEGYQTLKAVSAEAAEAIIKNHHIDVMLLDVNLPGSDGFSLLKEVRSSSDMGVIFVTRKRDDIDRIVGLELGADDYVTKPYNPRELLVRVKNLINRLHSARANVQLGDHSKVLAFGEIQLHVGRRVLRASDGTKTQLTEGEFKLLKALLDRPGEVLSRDAIMNQMDGRDWFPTDRTIDVLIARVRKKLGDSRENARFINTAHGAGYIFVAEVEQIDAKADQF